MRRQVVAGNAVEQPSPAADADAAAAVPGADLEISLALVQLDACSKRAAGVDQLRSCCAIESVGSLSPQVERNASADGCERAQRLLQRTDLEVLQQRDETQPFLRSTVLNRRFD